MRVIISLCKECNHFNVQEETTNYMPDGYIICNQCGYEKVTEHEVGYLDLGIDSFQPRET
jgi:hypothetical protein